MSKKQNPKSGNESKQGWKIEVIKILLTAIITSLLSYFLWNWQFEKTNEQKKWEKKFEIFSKLSDELANQQFLFSGKLKYNLELYSRTNGVPFSSIEEKRKTEDELKENLQYEYQGLVEYDNNMPGLLSAFFIAEATFGNNTDRAIADYLNNLVNKRPQDFVDAYLKKLNQKNATINIQELVDSIYIEANTYRKNLLEQMKAELGV